MWSNNCKKWTTSTISQLAIFKQLISLKIIELNRISIFFHEIFRISVELNLNLKSPPSFTHPPPPQPPSFLKLKNRFCEGSWSELPYKALDSHKVFMRYIKDLHLLLMFSDLQAAILHLLLHTVATSFAHYHHFLVFTYLGRNNYTLTSWKVFSN